MNDTRRSAPWRLLTLLMVALATLSLLGIGLVEARQGFLTRGIPQGLPVSVPYGGPRPALNVHLGQYNDAELAEALAEISSLGVDFIKQPFYFSADFDWDASDRLIAAASTQDLRLIPLLDGDPDSSFAPPEDVATFAAWAGAFADRYGEQIDSYIIWDEPNLSSHWGGGSANANEYAALLSAAAAAIRAADAGSVIVAAPLAPTVETGPKNIADDLYLQQLYEAGAADAFDVAAAKPYGFDTGPLDRRVDRNVLNFSRAVLLREVMERNNDAHTALWAGNWGWNSLPEAWPGPPSIWGEVSAADQAQYTVAALARARREWPWMGLMFLENWEPAVPVADPVWGFSIAGRETADALAAAIQERSTDVAYPGFHPARSDAPAQVYDGGWRFSTEFGADIGEPAPGEPPDRVAFSFWGTDLGLRVRRADFRARLYVTIDGEPANALPRDENGATLVLTSPDPTEDYVTTEQVARGLSPGVHTAEIVASRGWDQWALQGFAVGYAPFGNAAHWWQVGLLLAAVVFSGLALVSARRASWGSTLARWRQSFSALSLRAQVLLTGLSAAVVATSGWLTWGQQLEGLYRRFGDSSQLALTAGAAVLFYVAPSFFIYLPALVILFVLIFLRPAWGLALVAFTFPFYVPQLAKPIFAYRFSPVEVFMMVTAAAFALNWLAYGRRKDDSRAATSRRGWRRADYAVLLFVVVATLSLAFTERLDVATNEWRVVILEPALFYLVLRGLRPQAVEMWVILDAFVLGGLVVALIGLGQYVTGENLITAEAGLQRLRSVYGSPNNVSLYLGRVIPLLLGVFLLGEAGSRRRRLYGLTLIPAGLAMLLTFSKGGLLLGLPAGVLVVLWFWQRRRQRRAWPWIVGFLFLAVAGLLIAQLVPPIASRLDITGATSVFRLNLWGASLQMVREHPLFGVGLDNFLYAYRGRYIFDAAWQEPNLNHPHNIVLDFATRLGLLGLLAGGWMFWQLLRSLWRVLQGVPAPWMGVAAGLGGATAAVLIHGLVDHSFFLVDLAFSFYFLLGTAVWLDNLSIAPKISLLS